MDNNYQTRYEVAMAILEKIEEGGGGTQIEVVQGTGQSTTAVMSQKAVTDAINDIPESPITEDAPENGNLYARKDGSWEWVVSAPFEDDAPFNNEMYGRKNGNWVAVESGGKVAFVDYKGLYLMAEEDDCQVSLTTNSYKPNLQYSINGAEWSDNWDYSAITINTGDKLYFKGTNNGLTSGDMDDYSTFVVTKKFVAGGDIMSLLDGGLCQKRVIPSYYCFAALFRNTPITNAEELDLSATKAGYGCYCEMFRKCTELVYPPKYINFTTFYTTNYNMCKDMFAGCTKLVSSPFIKTTQAQNDAFEGMFNGCSSLTYIKCMLLGNVGSGWGYATGGWTNGVYYSGVFVKNAKATWDVSGENGIPAGWTVKLEAFEDEVFEAADSRYLTDAPSDDKQYARKNGAWAEVACLKKVTLTQEEYDALTTKDENTLYVIIESNVPDFTTNVSNVPDNHKFAIKVADASNTFYISSDNEGCEAEWSINENEILTSSCNGIWENAPLHIIKTTSEYYVIEAYSEGYGASLYDSNGEYTKFWKVND